MSSELFSPFRMNGVSLDNRIVVSPMGQYSGDGQGSATDWHMMHLGNLAISGAGLVIIEAAAVEPQGRVSPIDLGIWSDANAAALERVLGFCRKHSDCKWGMQIAHGGRKGGVSPAWKGQKPLAENDNGWTPVSASGMTYPGREQPIALDSDGLIRVRDAFVAAAVRARDLGVDVLEVHNAHGYLLHCFLTPFANNRNDEYGGDREGRMRFPLEVFAAVREVWPADRVLGVRISATDWAEGGWDLEDSIVFSQRLKDMGCDYITASSGGSTPDQDIPIGPGYQMPLAEGIKQEVDIAVMGVGLITEPAQAEKIIAEGQADLVALGRGMLFNPRWPWHAALELGGKITIPREYERCHPDMRSGDFLKPRMDG
ncbi:MAG: NADH:flavin oxidoreductase/NADH oxidase [Marinosulfonomonas sp.]|nr:NADH:flavin oxidoreductase/NADH oxidase [Marinosulfonomonas sp.]